jgi:hypothetical protein
VALVPQTSTGLPLIKLVGTVADLRAQRARDGVEELQPCRWGIQHERNGKLSWREGERERGSTAWESMCLLIGQHVGWLWAGLSFLLAFSFLFSFPYSLLQDACLVTTPCLTTLKTKDQREPSLSSQKICNALFHQLSEHRLIRTLPVFVT